MLEGDPDPRVLLCLETVIGHALCLKWPIT